MPRRITITELEAVVRLLNDITGSPAEPFRKDGDKFTPNAGSYHLSRAYGRFALHQTVDHGTGARDVLSSGHVPARELYNLLHAYRYGIYKGRDVARTRS